MTTDQPAPVSTSAAVAPAGPVPMTTASPSVGSGTPADLLVGVAARLYVSVEADHAPAFEVGVPAVFRCAVRTFARVRVEDGAKLALRGEPSVLLVAADVAE